MIHHRTNNRCLRSEEESYTSTTDKAEVKRLALATATAAKAELEPALARLAII